MSEEKTAKELAELTYGFTFKQFVQIMLSSKIFQDIYLEHFPDAEQHSLKQMYINIKNIGAEEKTLKVLEQLFTDQKEKVVNIADNNEQVQSESVNCKPSRQGARD
jgi:hypothetical protein